MTSDWITGNTLCLCLYLLLCSGPFVILH